MKTENKCFFSIRLKNGITITGKNPDMVKDFLSDLTLCIVDAIHNGSNDNYKDWKKYLYTLKYQLNDAWNTIYNNQLKKESDEIQSENME